MGQAFDKDGEMLNEAYGQTKRDVFDKLIEKHPDAAEIRIRSLHEGLPENDTPTPVVSGGPSTEMPRYRCFKEVWALKIKRIDVIEDGPAVSHGLITPTDDGYSPFIADHAYMLKHQPQVGGYYVVYKDGYKSFSPEAAFEEGYTRI